MSWTVASLHWSTPNAWIKSCQVFVGLALIKPAEFAECRTAMKGWLDRFWVAIQHVALQKWSQTEEHIMTIMPQIMKLNNEYIMGLMNLNHWLHWCKYSLSDYLKCWIAPNSLQNWYGAQKPPKSMMITMQLCWFSPLASTRQLKVLSLKNL